jgi:hypothetical protein
MPEPNPPRVPRRLLLGLLPRFPQRFLLAVLLFLAASAVAAQNQQTIVPADAEIVSDLKSLMVRAGTVPIFGDGPYSAAELSNELDRLERALAGESGADAEAMQRQAAALRAELEPSPDYREGESFQFRVTPVFALESYLNLRGSGFPWAHDVADRRPLFSLPLEAWVSEGAYANMRPDLRKNYPNFQNYITDANPDTVNPDPVSNVFSNLNEIDVQFPHQGFLSLGGDHWNVQFGRDHLEWGYGRTGQLLLSDYADYHDYLRLSAFFDGFKFQTVWLSLEPWLTDAETAEGAPEEGGPPDLHKSFLAHRFNVRLWGWGNLSYTEATMFGRDDMELRYLNPLVSYHNWFVNPDLTNTLHSFELELVPAPGLLGYGAAALDQWSAPVEEGSYTEDEPDAFGFMAGLTWFTDIGPGELSVNGEWVRTDPWLYIGPYPHTSYYTRRRVQAENSEGTGKVLLDKPLGYRYGPDAQVFSLYGQYSVPDRYTLGIEGLLRFKGENTIRRLLPPESDADLNRVTPSGENPERVWELTLSGRAVPLPLLQIRPAASWATELRVGSDLTFLWIENRGAVAKSREFDMQLRSWLRLEL